MKSSRPYPSITVSKKCQRFLSGGHLWVYDNEILNAGEITDGSIADVLSENGTYLGTGFFNSHSKIRVRIISKNANDRFDEAFWERRIRYAVEHRKNVIGKLDSVRLIFGEADGFPGLTVDKFEDVVVTQTLSLGIEQRKNIIFPLIVKVLSEYGENVNAIFERNDVAIREKEGMTQGKGFFVCDGLSSSHDENVIIDENGVKYNVDIINGQKTGFFLDQRYNRLAAAKIAKGKKVLDCFTHTGAFALNCAMAGAEHVTAVDISSDAIEITKSNAVLNGLENLMSFEVANVFDLLTELCNSKQKPYDFIILDPPAFTKSGATVKNATRGYKEINMKAMKILPRGGYLATCSCSHFMTDELFRKMLHDAAADAGVSLLQIEARQQSPDHPILWNVPETDYLKFYLFRVI